MKAPVPVNRTLGRSSRNASAGQTQCETALIGATALAPFFTASREAATADVTAAPVPDANARASIFTILITFSCWGYQPRKERSPSSPLPANEHSSLSDRNKRHATSRRRHIG